MFGVLTLFGCIAYCIIYCRRPEVVVRPEVLETHYQKNMRYLPNTIDYYKPRNYMDPEMFESRYTVSRNSGAYSSDIESRRSVKY